MVSFLAFFLGGFPVDDVGVFSFAGCVSGASGFILRFDITRAPIVTLGCVLDVVAAGILLDSEEVEGSPGPAPCAFGGRGGSPLTVS